MRESRESESLTAREQQVMQEVVSGRLNKQIAGELNITAESIFASKSNGLRV